MPQPSQPPSTPITMPTSAARVTGRPVPIEGLTWGRPRYPAWIAAALAVWMAAAPALSFAQERVPAPLPASAPDGDAGGDAASRAARRPAPTTSADPMRLPTLGDSVSESLSLSDERQLGDQVMHSILRDPDVFDDPLLTEYIQSLWQPLVQAGVSKGEISADMHATYAWRTFLIRDRSVNAFALPGGFVGVYLGLIAMTDTRDELASVLAHEMSHVTQRHIARSMENARQQGIAALAATILGLVAASRSADGMQAVLVGSQAAFAAGQLSFSREMEREADRVGLNVMGGAGFATSGMAAMFGKLDSVSRLNDDNQYPYLRTHPLTIERISEARLRANSQPATRPPEPAEQSLMQVRARALMDTRAPSLRRLQMQGDDLAGTPQAAASDLARLYGAAIASVQLRDVARADDYIRQGQALASSRFADEPQGRRAFDLLALTSASDRADVAAIRAALPLLDSDDSRPAMLARAQAALALQRAGAPEAMGLIRASSQQLQAYVVAHAADANAWASLSALAGAQGQRIRQLRADAEASAAISDLNGAIDRLRSAQRAARDGSAPADAIESSIVDTRLRQLVVERHRMAAIRRGEDPDRRPPDEARDREGVE